jgi:arylsulfatase A-like enzyme
MKARGRGGPAPRLALRWAALAAAATLLAGSGCTGAARPDLDVVIFLIDTLRADRTGPYGREPSPTPFLDQLAAESVVFEDAYAPAPWTLPSTVSLLTSQPLCRHGVSIDGETVAPELATLAERMRARGWRTGSLFANPFAGPLSGLDRGFEVSRLVASTDGETVGRWLDAVGDQAFFLYVHNVEPHDPYEGARPVPPQRESRVNRLLDRHRELTRADWLAGRPPGTTRNEDEQDRVRRELSALRSDVDVLYDADVERADGRLASTVAELRARGRLERTILVVASDHGEEFGEHGGWQHDQALYEELVRVPLLIRLPGARHGGRRVTAPVSLVDVVPTLAELLGDPGLAEDAAGRSLVPLLEGEADAGFDARAVATRWNRKKYYHPLESTRGNLNVAVREGRWKAIWNAASDTVELYDLERDPAERHDVSAEQPERAARLAALARAEAAPCLERAPRAAAPPALDPATRERLRELGYVDE